MTRTEPEKPAAGCPPADVLGDVLETLRFRGNIFFRSQLAAPWGMKLSPAMTPRFHIALQGDCVIGTSGEQPLRLREMEILLLPHGDMHWIADHPGRDLVDSERAGAACELGNPLFQQGPITNRLICGMVRYEHELLHPLLDALPRTLHFADIEPDDPVWTTVQLIDAEMERGGMLRSTLVDRLSEVLFLQLLYRYVESEPELPGFLSALSDRRIHRMLGLIHDKPAAPWTLESLARESGMSRATAARRFNDIVGMPPMAYLANWRLMKAHQLSRHSHLPFEEIAERVGFGSARSLGKAFVRAYGCTPAQLRRRARD